MKYILISFIALLHFPVSGQPGDAANRKLEIEECTVQIYSITEFEWIADSLQLSVYELSDYPLIFPIRKPERISSGFGMRIHPIYKMRQFHTGIDLSGAKDTPVYATGNGVVKRIGYCSGYGYFVEIEHSGGFRSFYAHLSKILVNTGDPVGIGKQIACVGNSGVTTGYHLHYEIRKGNHFLNPVGWCYLLFEIWKNKS